MKAQQRSWSALRLPRLPRALCIGLCLAASTLTACASAATAQPLSRAEARAVATVADLPLEWVAPKGTSAGTTAVLLTGDGGWATLIHSVADGLAAEGIAVVALNSRKWLSSNRTPDATAAAVVRAIDAARARWPADKLVIVGYSRGADFAPFVATRLPTRLASQLQGLALFGLAPYASFEFHFIDLVKDTRRSSDIPLLPELAKLRGMRMVCVFGEEEPTSGCRDAPQELLRKDMRDGGHHFDGNVDALVNHVLWLVAPKNGAG